MDEFNKGDKVKLANGTATGVVVEVLPMFLDVLIDDTEETRFWFRGETVKYNPFVWGEDRVATECICDSRDLFHYGCRCGFFAKERDAI